jgi:putative NIF3 family GTP cyclohydrolase 1 type 2
MFLEEIISLLENKISPKLFKLNSEIYGIHYGSKNNDKVIKKVMITLDLSLEAIHHAIKNKTNLIITQRGLINKAVKDFNYELVRKLTLLTKYPISVFVLSTPFTAAEGGISDTIRESLFLKLDKTFNIKGKNGNKIPLGRVCYPQEYSSQETSMRLEDLLKRIKNNLDLKKLFYIGKLHKNINKICIIGSNNLNLKYFKKAIKYGCDCYITSEIKNDEIIYARDSGVALIFIPYFKLEVNALKKLCNILSLEFPRDEIFMYESEDPVQIY